MDVDEIVDMAIGDFLDFSRRSIATSIDVDDQPRYSWICCELPSEHFDVLFAIGHVRPTHGSRKFPWGTKSLLQLPKIATTLPSKVVNPNRKRGPKPPSVMVYGSVVPVQPLCAIFVVPAHPKDRQKDAFGVVQVLSL